MLQQKSASKYLDFLLAIAKYSNFILHQCSDLTLKLSHFPSSFHMLSMYNIYIRYSQHPNKVVILITILEKDLRYSVHRDLPNYLCHY